MNLNGRKHDLQIFGPVGLQSYIDCLIEIGTLYLDFKLEITEINAGQFQKVFEDKLVEVFSIPLKHRIPTTGFLFKEKRKPNKVIPEKIDQYNLTIEEIKSLKKGEDIYRSSKETLKNSDFTIEGKEPSVYAFCSDTIYDEDLVKHIKDASLVYHEATYLDEFKEKARERGHSTAVEAAKIAKMANAKHLVLGHYSSRYKDVSAFKSEAAPYFEHVSLAEDGREFVF
jgi:ribonuclease Z